MVEADLLEILRCPADHSSLTVANTAVVARINELIANEEVTNKGGQPLKKQLDGGLVREAGDLLYPILDNIPVMLADEAIDLTHIGVEI